MTRTTISLLAAIAAYVIRVSSSPMTPILDRGDVCIQGDDTSGCGKTHWFNGAPISHSVTSGGIHRSYLIHGSIGFFFEADTRLDDPKYTADKIMVYPDGLGGNWAGANYSTATTTTGLAIRLGPSRRRPQRVLMMMISRIYATGLSNGGGFVGTLTCNDTVEEEFAGRFGFWAQCNGCITPPAQEDSFNSFNNDVHRLIWTCEGQCGALQHYNIDDQKHDWPSTEINFSQPTAGDKPTHISASAIIQDFFMNFTRPA